jgi:hypothetical protein
MDSEFEFNGHRYRVAHQPAMQQFHVMRRLGPTLVGALGGLLTHRDKLMGFLDTKLAMEAAMPFLLEAMSGPLVGGLSRLSDEDAEYVVSACLSNVRRQETKQDAWALVMTGGRMMFPDLDHLPSMLGLVVQVIRAQLQGFFPASGPAGSGGETGGTGQPSPGARTG